MRPEPLVRAILSAMLFLEEGGPDQVNQDSAINVLESMGYELLQLSEEDRLEFIELIERMAKISDDNTAAFLRTIPFSIGMTDSA